MKTKTECSIIVLMDNLNNDSGEFVVASPDQQVGLSPQIEHGTKPKEYLNRYHADYDVRCAFCAGHTPHRRGFTVRMEDGRTALCGIDCAKVFFGEEIALRFEQDLQQQEKAHSQRKLLSRTVEGAPAALKVLTEEWIDVERSFATAVIGLMPWIDAESFAKELSDDALVLMRNRSVFVNTTARDGREIKKKKTISEIEARILGAGCLLISGKPMALAKGGLVSLAGRAEKPDMITGSVVDDLMKKRSEVIRLIEDGIRFVRMAQNFFQKPNIEKFVVWHHRTYKGSHPKVEFRHDYRVTISHPESNGLPTTVYLPRDIPDAKLLLEPLKGRS